jgi:hypothetical protein
MQPAIVIPAYNRPNTLARLFASLETANYPTGIRIPLIISLDPEKEIVNPNVREVAESFQWEYGPKEIVLHPVHLGLLENFYFCGNLTGEFDSVIFLEDDSVVSPVFYQYAMQALDYFETDKRIAGVSLHRYAFNGYTHHPFTPLTDGYDIFFMQVSSIMGQAWSKTQWNEFTNWRISASADAPKTKSNLHTSWSKFDADDHFPILTNYLVATGRYYIFPQISLTSGFGDTGTHFKNSTSYFQVPLQYDQTSFRLRTFDSSNSVYDSFMEILPERLKRIAPVLQGIDFVVDLNATKEPRHLTGEYVVTTRPCNHPLKTFSLSMKPMEASLILNVSGEGINLCRTSDVLWDKRSEFQTRLKFHNYYSNKHQTGLRQLLINFLFELINRFER